MAHIGAYSQPAADGFVFTTEHGQPLRGNNFRDREWTNALRDAGLPYRPPHTMRHLSAMRLADAGFTSTQCARWLGDTAAVVERTYVNFLPSAHDEMSKVFARQQREEVRV